MQTDGRVRGDLVTDASGARALICSARVIRAPRAARATPARSRPIRAPQTTMDQTKWSVDAPTMKASTQTGESGVCETTAAWWGRR